MTFKIHDLITSHLDTAGDTVGASDCTITCAAVTIAESQGQNCCTGESLFGPCTVTTGCRQGSQSPGDREDSSLGAEMADLRTALRRQRGG